MLASLLSLLLAVPAAPVLRAPAPEGWTIGTSAHFEVGDYEDDAGVPPLSLRLEFRAEDAGYGSMNEAFPFAYYVLTTQQFPVEGARWCWRARHVNTLNQVSDPSAERCFRTDFTPPVSGFVDAGAIVSNGLVRLDMQPGTDALSGLLGYFLELAPTPTGPFGIYGADEPQLPIQTWVGEGSWFGWVRVTDNALNDNRFERGSYAVPITVTAAPGVPVPEAPSFESAVTNAYGDALVWDGGWMPDAGVTHVVASFCKVDAGCVWHHGFHGLPVTSRSWQQLEGEGPMVARVAVVQGGQVGAWSPPSAPVLVDRTPPSAPGQASSVPMAARMGPLSVSWGAATDDFTGLSQYRVQVTEQLSGTSTTAAVNAPAVMTSTMPPADGRYEVRVAAVDVAGNQSAFSAAAISVIDSHGPTSQRPMAVATALDGGALVSISWSLPTDLLSAVTSLELREVAVDGGAQLVSVTGLAASRTLPPGEWRWQLRGTDALGNVGLFSEPSNAILVTAQGVVNGPSILTTELEARCGEPFSAQLAGQGDEPRSWTLLSGPSGLTVSDGGLVTWTPPDKSAVDEVLRVKLNNAAGFVNADVQLLVSCDAQPPPDGGAPRAKSLIVGCGCSVMDPLLPLVLAVMVLRRRRLV